MDPEGFDFGIRSSDVNSDDEHDSPSMSPLVGESVAQAEGASNAVTGLLMPDAEENLGESEVMLMPGTREQPLMQTHMHADLEIQLKASREDNLRQRGVLSTSGCSLCGSPEESVLHIAVYCPFARAVWFSSPLQIDSQVLAGCSFINWWSELMCRGQGYHDEVVWKASAAYLLWGIWKSRNRAKFDHARIDPVWTMQHAMGCAAEFLKVHKEKERVGVNISEGRAEGQVQWKSPPPGMVKINFDGAFVPNLKVGGVGVVARADDGSFLFARSCGGLKARSAIVMEGLALRVGVLLAKDQGIRRVVFEGDAKGLIDMLNGKPAGCEDIQLLVMDILQLCSSFFDAFSFVFVGRVCNVVAHELARKGCSLGSCSTWLVIPPLWLWDLVCREKCSCS
ncbi:hypothetical protein Vadar_009395 [Vaccinium darrowii]|uniref:Uncharacterized protein n=1 Tax=Vaccinium darrowii TaxID=229202 RepID=A0ACB7XPG8_9ERIC|nr:hypothetical protein Vadar_009395 [Vaccinium darrowii]